MVLKGHCAVMRVDELTWQLDKSIVGRCRTKVQMVQPGIYGSYWGLVSWEGTHLFMLQIS